MDLMKDMQKYFEDGAKQVAEYMNKMAGGNPVGDMLSGFYKDMMAQSKDMMAKFFQNDFYNKLVKDMEGYKSEIMGKFTDLTKNFGDFSKIQKQFESFVTENNKKFMDMANVTFKDSYEKFSKGLMENLSKFDFSKFFQTAAPAEKKAAPAAAKKA